MLRLSFQHFILPLLLPFAFAACTTTTTQAPTIPATAFSATAIVTAAAPTVSDTELPAQVLTSFNKTRALVQVRYEITSTISFNQNGATVRQQGLNAQGQENGENRQLMISGIMNSTGEATSFEFITLNGVTYMKGLNGIPGVDAAQWYKFPPDLGNMTRDAPSVKTLLAEIQQQDLKQAIFTPDGVETLDGHPCNVWVARDPKLAKGFIGIANNAQAADQLQALDAGEFRVWTCEDGYMHRLTGSLQGHDPANPSNQATMQLTLHLYDHDAPIEIVAPANAKEFQVPVQETNSTPTP